MRITLKTYFLALIGLCFAYALFSMVLVAGVAATPWGTADSRGRTMQFGERFSPEHYWMALGNFRPASLCRAEFAYEWLVLLAILIGVWCLWSDTRSTRRATRWYFFAQLALFCPGTLSLALLVWPHLMLSLIRFEADRETFVDIPIGLILTQSPWVLVSMTLVLALPGQPLGLKKEFAKFRRWTGDEP